MKSREDILYCIKLAEQVERYDDMILFLHSLLQHGTTLSKEEQLLLASAYKNYIDPKRIAYQILSSISEKCTLQNSKQSAYLASYQSLIQSEISAICTELNYILDTNLLAYVSDPESAVFYYRLKGDYWMYYAETLTGEQRIEVTNKSQNAYELAITLAAKELPATNPVKLETLLNYSLLWYAIYGDSAKAKKIAQFAFDAAVCDLNKLDEKSYKQAIAVLQILRENIVLWTSPEEDDEEI